MESYSLNGTQLCILTRGISDAELKIYRDSGLEVWTKEVLDEWLKEYRVSKPLSPLQLETYLESAAIPLFQISLRFQKAFGRALEPSSLWLMLRDDKSFLVYALVNRDGQVRLYPPDNPKSYSELGKL